jgi:hypothetical protein
LQAAQHAGLEAVLVEVAEIEPVRPGVVQGGVEPPDFVDQVNLSRIDIVALDTEHQPSQETLERQPLGPLVRAVDVQEMGKVPALHLLAAELVNNEVSVHRKRNPAGKPA